MKIITLADAKVQLSELVDQVQDGSAVLITHRGKQVAQLTAVDRPRKPIDVSMLRALTESMPAQPEGAAEFIRRMRDEDRY